MLLLSLLYYLPIPAWTQDRFSAFPRPPTMHLSRVQTKVLTCQSLRRIEANENKQYDARDSQTLLTEIAKEAYRFTLPSERVHCQSPLFFRNNLLHATVLQELINIIRSHRISRLTSTEPFCEIAISVGLCMELFKC